jgi:uncharacterized membrane protein YjgN (DUF898 family)
MFVFETSLKSLSLAIMLNSLKKEVLFMNKSEFTGGLLGLIGTNLLAMIIVVFTLGIGLPWAVCIRQSWYANHTKIDGRQLVFDGTAIELFGQYIKWFLLTIVTLGIYSLWLNIKMHAWVVSKTHLTA